MPTSSRWGWRQTICAARAPVKPEAPATRTLAFSLTKRPSNLAQLSRDRLAPDGDLFVGEGAVRRPELEPQGKALAVLTQLLSIVEIEDLGGPQQLTAPGENRATHLRRRHIVGHDDGEILEPSRKGCYVLEGLLAGGGGIDQHRQSGFKADRGVQVPLAADERVQLADPARVRPVDEHLRAAAWMQERLVGVLEGERHAEPSRKTLQNSLEREEVRCLAPTPPRARRQWYRHQAAEPLRLDEGRRLLAGESPGKGIGGGRTRPPVSLRPPPRGGLGHPPPPPHEELRAPPGEGAVGGAHHPAPPKSLQHR